MLAWALGILVSLIYVCLHPHYPTSLRTPEQAPGFHHDSVVTCIFSCEAMDRAEVEEGGFRSHVTLELLVIRG